MGRIKPKEEVFALLDMLRSASHTAEREIVLKVILEKARFITKAVFAVAKITDASRKHLSTIGLSGFKHKICPTFSRFDDEIAAKVLKNGSPIVVDDVDEYFKARHIPVFFRSNGIRAFLIVPLYSNKRKAGTLSLYIQEKHDFKKEELDMVEMVAGFLSMVVDNAAMLERIRKDYLNTIKTLARIIDENDPYTRGHCEKVKRYSMMICAQLKLPEKQVSAIKTASLLHDIGKIGIDPRVLRKTGKLDSGDWQKIRKHPDIGSRIVGQVGFLNDIVPMIKYHHSRYDGNGYPDPARRAHKIPLGARIIAVADAFDAMTSNRPYRKAMSKEYAITELRRCAGSQFDPEVTEAFVKSLIS